MRILLGIVLALSVSFACDQPHEEVGGYYIGCWYDPSGMNRENKEITGVDVYTGYLSSSFFQAVELALINDKLEELTFFSAYDDNSVMKRDVDSILEKFTKRWGQYKTIEAGNGKTAYLFYSPNSNVLDNVSVVVVQNYNSNGLGVTYTSKLFVKHKKDQEDRLKNEKLKKLQGF